MRKKEIQFPNRFTCMIIYSVFSLIFGLEDVSFPSTSPSESLLSESLLSESLSELLVSSEFPLVWLESETNKMQNLALDGWHVTT